jgi:acyl-CoA synthetase (AMP-forming)/AMP-acid ligase II/thioesterase domain-containing protein/acyl carrier protein
VYTLIRDLIRRPAARRPDAPALLAPGYRNLSYANLEAAAGRIGAALRNLGLTESARLALVCSNGPEAAVGFLGLAAHAACAPLNSGYAASEFEFFLTDLRPQAVVVEAGLHPAVRQAAAARRIPIVELARRASGLAGDVELLPGEKVDHGDPPPGEAPHGTDVALLLHTSGTTSRPKLVPLTQENLVASARHIARSLALTAADRCLNVMPLFHIHGLEAAVLASLVAGAGVVCCPGFVGPKFFEWIEEFQPTWYTAVPTLHQLVLLRAKTRNEPAARTSLRFIRSCSSALAPSLMQELERVFHVPVIEAYGMTEAAHQMASNPLPPGKRKPGSVGIPAGPEISIMDDAGKLLPPGAAGEVVIRGPNVTAGYCENPSANAAAFTEGWFRTGDEGWIDAEGYLFLNGRKKEIINRGGEKICPREIDEVLLSHPAVAQAIAFAVPDSLLGEAVAAVVVLAPGQPVTELALREFAAERLAAFKIPAKIVFLDEIPKGPTGKVQRIGLAARLGIAGICFTARPPFVAPRSKLEKRLAAIFADTLSAGRVGVDDSFFDLGGDSLLSIALLAQIEASEGLAISFAEFTAEPTVCGVSRRLASRQPDPSPVGGLADREFRVVIGGGTGEPALFCVPGSSGSVAPLFRLARSLCPDRPLTAFRLPPRGYGRYRLEDLAARYVAETLAQQPEGPYHLAGVCTGGFVVYEMARQLSAAGKEVGVVALLDCYNHAWPGARGPIARFGYRLDLLFRRLVYQQRKLRQAGLAGAGLYVRSKARASLRTWRARSRDLPIHHAVERYAPSPSPGRLVLFRVEEPHVGGFSFPEMGWRGLALGGIVIHDLPGSHLAMLAEPAVGLVARALADAMREAVAPSATG